MTKVISESEKITFKCVKCGNEVTTTRGIVSLGCLNLGCQKSQIYFLQDVLRRPHEGNAWQDCPASKAFDSGYMSGTTISKLYEVIRKDMVENKSVSESEVQFEEKKIEKKSEEPKKKAENPLYKRLAREKK